MKQTQQAINDIFAINTMARQARLLCNDIIRQTSLKPYYGKVGAAALYAPDDKSEEQLRRIRMAVRNMQRATSALYGIAIAGGMSEAKAREIMSHDYWRNQVTIIEDDGEQ